MPLDSLNRRLLLTIIITSVACACIPLFACTQQIKKPSIQAQFVKLEESLSGRIGIYAIDMSNNQHIEYRSTERFPIQSTFKLMGVSAILKKSMKDSDLLQQKMLYKKQDLIFWSPITEKYIAEGMIIKQLCAAAMMHSDNTAINLLMKQLGGPKAVTAFARSIGDNTFRLDNWEAQLNSNPHDFHDTSTPIAMEKSLQKLVFGNVLASPQRKQLIVWMKSNMTGNTRIRAGVPKAWIVADKTGSSNRYGITNDIGIIWPPNCPPIIVTIYLTQNKKNATPHDDLIASATRILIRAFASKDSCINTSLGSKK